MLVEVGSLEFVGREEELSKLSEALERAKSGKGQTLLISGEAGLGKTRIVEEFLKLAEGVRVITGSAVADTVKPFLLFSNALEQEIGKPLFEEREFTTLAKIFAIGRSGLLIGQASPEVEEEMDPDIFAGMFSAVQDFIRDSMVGVSEGTAGLGRLEYGDMKILVEHGRNIFLTAIFKGAEHPEMRKALKRTVQAVEKAHGSVLASWSGRAEEVAPIQDEITSLAGLRFLVRKELEDVQLETERFRISDKVLGILTDACKETPLVLFLEDLHWADESSIFVLKYIARNIRDGRILVIGTLRPGENNALQDAIEKAREEGIIDELALEKLGGESIAHLVDEIYPGNDFPETFVNSISTQCEGNPLFVKELLWQMGEEGNVRKDAGRYVLFSQDYSLPSSVEEVVQKRLLNLDPDVMAMAEYASCIGKVFDTGAASSLEIMIDAPLSLEKLQNTGIVVSKNGQYEFSHALFHDVTYRSIGERWRQAYHRSLGEYYESAYEDEEVLYELTRHFSRSSVHLKTFEYGVRTVDKAEAAFAPEQAIEILEVVLRAIPHLSGDLRKVEEIKARTRLGQNLQLMGRLDDAEDVYREIITLARKEDDELLLAEICTSLGHLLCHKPDYEESIALSKEAFEMFSAADDNTGMFKALGNMGYVHYYQGRYDEALKCFRDQVQLAAEMGDQIRVGRALSDIGGIYLDTGKYDEAMEYNRRYLEIAEEFGDKHAIKDALSGMANVSFNQKDYSFSLECYDRLVEVSRDSGDLFMESLGLIGLGAAHEVLGNYEAAKENLDRSLKNARKMNYKQGLPYALIYLGRIYSNQGAYGEAMDRFREALEISESIQTKRTLNFAWSSLGNLHKTLKEHAEAEGCYDEAIAIGRELDHKHVLCGNLYQLADLYFLMGRGDESRALNEEALSMAESIDQQSVVFQCRVLGCKLLVKTDKSGAVSRLEGMLDEIDEDKERASVLYELHGLTGDRGAEALDLYVRLYEAVPNVLYKDRIEELGG